jgi:putative ABC transport system ATP-binding protein
MIKLTQVTKIYRTGSDSVTALKNISFEIETGEFVIIIGPSGSGKSTLLHLIGGLDTPTGGEITVDNKKINTLKDKELSRYRNREIGFIFQDFHLAPNLDLLDNTKLPLFFNKAKRFSGLVIAQKAKEMLNELFLTDRMKHLPSQISGGQKQRAAIARALINKPKILLADEPTGNLDSTTGKKIIGLLKEIHRKNKMTMVIVTHDKEIAKNAKRVIEIRDGILVEKTN